MPMPASDDAIAAAISTARLLCSDHAVTDERPSRRAADTTCSKPTKPEYHEDVETTSFMANYVDQDTDEEELHGKTVKWATITVYEFGVDIGPSSVPTKGGPPIGLAGRPEFTWSTRVGEMAECSEGVHRFTREERVALLRAAGVSDNMITRHARETNIVLQSRRRSLTETLVESESDEDDDDDVDDVDVMDAFLRPRVCKRPALDSGAPFVRRSRMIPTNYV